VTETVTHAEPASQPDHFAAIAAELRKTANGIETLIGSDLPKPSYVALTIHAGGRGRDRDDDLTGRAVDALGIALLGKPGTPEKMTNDTYHYGTEQTARGPIKVHVYDSVSTAWAVRREATAQLAEREAELATLRAEVAALRAAAALTPDADPTGLDYTRADSDEDDPTPVSPARVPLHVGRVDSQLAADDQAAGAPEPVIRYFSFGHGHRDPVTGGHLIDRYVTVIAPTADACRRAMIAKYGRAWSFEYVPGTVSAQEWIPRWTEHDRIDLTAAPAAELKPWESAAPLADRIAESMEPISAADCGCPVRPYPEGRGDAADTIVTHGDGCRLDGCK
jgi:hypothetical protein